MSAKAIVLFCAQAFLLQSISALCNGWGAGLAYDAPLLAGAGCGGVYGAAYDVAGPWAGAGYGLGAIGTSGGGFPTSSASPIPPVGVSVLSENEIGGILAVGGELPFLGTVGLEGVLPTAGAGVVSYGCGDGAVGMISEDIAGAAWGYPGAAGWGYGPGIGAGIGYGPGLGAGIGYGPAIGARAFGGCGLI